MRNMTCAIVVLLFFMLSLPVMAQDAAPATTDAQPAAEKAAVEPAPAPAKTEPAPAKAEPAPVKAEPAPAKVEPAPAKAEEVKIEPPKAEAPKKKNENVLSSLGNKLTFYGFLRLDINYDTSRSNLGNWALWINPNKTFTRQMFDKTGKNIGVQDVDPQNGGQLTINPRLTRLGLKFAGTKIEMLNADLGGKLEIDFYGGDVTKKDWAAVPRFRLAYLSLDWGFMEIVAGQAWDFFSPMIPRIDYNGGSWAIGNVGGRRPQLQLKFKPKVGESSVFHVDLGIGRPGTVDGADYDMIDANKDGVISSSEIGNGKNDGEDSGIPQFSWHVGFESPLWTNKPFKVGVGGHLEHYKVRSHLWDSTANAYNKRDWLMRGYSICAELSVPLLDWWAINGEFFYGENLKSIWGGIYQDINKQSLTGEKPEAVKGLGFWAETTIQPWDVWALTVGFQMDKPDEDTLPDGSNYKLMEATRYKNQNIYVNSQFYFGSGFSVGVQYMYMTTDYKYADSVVEDDLTALNVKTYSAVNHRSHVYFMYAF